MRCQPDRRIKAKPLRGAAQPMTRWASGMWNVRFVKGSVGRTTTARRASWSSGTLIQVHA
jgi:hypothetical protein